MTFTPNPPFAVGGPLTATVDNSVANWGAGSWQTGRITQPVETYETASLNVLNEGASPPAD